MKLYTYEQQDDPIFPFKANVGGYVFRTEERARLFCQMWNEHNAAMEPLADLPRELSREAYEAACIQFGVSALSDADCQSYGVKYGEFTPWLVGNETDGYRIGGYAPKKCVEMYLARRRTWGIEAERKARPKQQRQPDYPDGRELDCGCIAYFQTEVMRASLGTACQDCYDRMSD